MHPIIDLAIINISAIMAFVFRQNFGDIIIKQAPSLYWPKYALVLLLLNLTYPIIFWLLGLYDRRQKRALLEEYLLIFGVFSASISILIIFLFLGRLWWMSRIVLFAFWGSSIVLLCFSRLFNRKKIAQKTIDANPLINSLAQQKNTIKIPADVSLSIVIVAVNSQQIMDCLNSILNAGLANLLEIIVVDNRSMDNLNEQIRKNWAQVKVIKTDQRLGYSRSINLALRQAQGSHYLVLNPDIIVLPGAIEIMLDYFAANPKVGIAGCQLLNTDGTLQFSCRRFLDLRTYLYRFTPLRGLMAGSQIERAYLMQDWDHKNNSEVDWVLGGCMLIRKNTFEQLGGMDERYFLYFEDIDLCFEAWEKGWQVVYVANATMFHKHMRSSANKLFNRATYEHIKSLFKFISKHGFSFPKNSPSVQEMMQ